MTCPVLDVLRYQHDILAEPAHWTRGALARSLLGQSVVPLSDRALAWSLSGALACAVFQVLGPSAAQNDWQRLYDASLDALWHCLPADHPRTARKTLDLDGFNDYVGYDHSDVLGLVERSIELVRA